jgi:hypothetical protein
MQHTYELKNTLNAEDEKGLSWGNIVAKYYPNEDPEKFRSLLWKIAKTNYDPKNNRLRERLGLVMLKRVEACLVCNDVHFARCPKADESSLPRMKMMDDNPRYATAGDIPSDCQVIGEYKTCACGKRFVPNSPKRYNCFDCQKVRKRKK